MQKFTGGAFATTTSKPEETCVILHIVTEGTIAAVTPIVQHMATDWGRRHGRINNVLSEVEVGVCHDTCRSGSFLREFWIHRKKNIDTRIQLLLKVKTIGTRASFVNRAGHCCYGCAGIGRSSRPRCCFFALNTILSRSSRSEKSRSEVFVGVLL